jgi:methyl-accepting chemotaxis protein
MRRERGSMTINNLRLPQKMTVAFAAVLSIVALMSVFLMTEVSAVTSAEKLNSESYNLVDLIDQTKADTFNQMKNVQSYLLTRNAAYLTEEAADERDFEQDFAHARKLTDGRTQLALLLDQVKTAHDDWKTQAGDPAVKLARESGTEGQSPAAASAANDALAKAFRADVEQVLADANTWSNAEEASASGALHLIKVAVIAGGAVTALLSLAIGWGLTRAIGRPVVAMTEAMKRLASGDNAVEVPATERKDEVGEMAVAVQTFKAAAIEKIALEKEAGAVREAAEAERVRNGAAAAQAAATQAQVVQALASGLDKLAQGDLTFRLETRFAADYEKLRADFNAAMGQLQQTMSVIAGAARGITSSTGEISEASNDLARRTEQQAARLEEAAAALDQITATVRRTAQGAGHARTVVGAAKAQAEQSGLVVRDTVEAMAAIEVSAREIGQIIGVIDEIAFQTSLLALNAGVEAARAGDAVRGFAVVATEVRALAQRSADAAKEIKILISASSGQVAQGVQLVGQTGTALETIIAQVNDINGVVTEISASAQEQATGLGEVNVAVNQMDQTTQQNAAMVEQSTTVSHALAQEARELNRLLGQFHIEDGVHVPAPVPAPRARRAAGSPPRTVGNTALQLQPASDEDWAEF